jgi:hypothetical protein
MFWEGKAGSFVGNPSSTFWTLGQQREARTYMEINSRE